jgi:hypothetical protein
MPSGRTRGSGRFPALFCPTRRRRFLLRPESCDEPWGFFRVMLLRAGLGKGRGPRRNRADAGCRIHQMPTGTIARGRNSAARYADRGRAPAPASRSTQHGVASIKGVGRSQGAVRSDACLPTKDRNPRRAAAAAAGRKADLDALPSSGCAHRPESEARYRRWRHLDDRAMFTLRVQRHGRAARASGPMETVLRRSNRTPPRHLGAGTAPIPATSARRDAFRWQGETGDLAIQG